MSLVSVVNSIISLGFNQQVVVMQHFCLQCPYRDFVHWYFYHFRDARWHFYTFTISGILFHNLCVYNVNGNETGEVPLRNYAAKIFYIYFLKCTFNNSFVNGFISNTYIACYLWLIISRVGGPREKVEGSPVEKNYAIVHNEKKQNIDEMLKHRIRKKKMWRKLQRRQYTNV